MTPERWRQVTAIFHAALAHEAFGRVAYLDQAWKGYNERPSGTSNLKIDPRTNPLRSDPRYQDLLRRMALPQ